MKPRNATVFVFLGAAILIAQPAGKRPLTHKDYDAWRSISTQSLSRDGRWLAYGVFPQEGDGELVVRDLRTGKERREAVGALPPPPIPEPGAEPEDGPPRRPNIRIAFTADAKYLVSSTFPAKADTDAAKKARKHAPKGGLLLIDLTAGRTARVENVKSYQVPERAGDWMAYLKEPEPAEKAEEKKEAASPARGASARPQFGSGLIVRRLDKPEPNERSLEDVTEYAASKDGRTLVYAVSSKNEEKNGIYALDPAADAPPRPVLAGKGKYVKLAWDRAQSRVAFLSSHDDPAVRPAKYKLWLWDRNSGQAKAAVSGETAGFHADWAISEHGSLQFSRDGSRLFLGCAPVRPEPPDAAAAPAGNKVLADLWHWKDDFIQPIQKIRAARERNRTYTAALRLSDGAFTQLGGPDMPGVVPSDDGRFALGVDDRPYRRLIDYDTAYSDFYVIDTATGERRRIVSQQRGGTGGGLSGPPPLAWAPDGKHVVYYRDRHWHAISIPDGRDVNLTAGVKAAFYNEEDDRPEPASAHGAAGWTRDGTSVLLYDRHDVWRVSPAAAAENVTGGLGRKLNLQFRVVQLENDEEQEARGIDPAKPLLLRAENLETRDSSFWRDRLGAGARPERLIMAPKNLRTVAKAKDADVVLLTVSSFREFPDLHISNSNFRELRKVSDLGFQTARFAWGSAELIRYKNADGVPLQAALYKPENMDPAKKYPMIVYIYERLSQVVNNFVEPRPGTSINISYYVSNGYVVLTPDIVYTTGEPGPSALKCILPAVEAAVAKGFVDEKAIGIQGHSWGGYQAAYLIGHTTRFAAAEAGAPVGNMISAYNGIRWGSGLPRQFQYEQSQSRIGGSLWQYPLRFIENSPIFSADKIQTPLLMLHDDQDDAVPWYQGIELYLSLRRLGKEVYMWTYNGEFHGLRRRHNQMDYTARMQQFFDHFLKGAPKPEWMEKGVAYLDRETEKEQVWK